MKTELLNKFLQYENLIVSFEQSINTRLSNLMVFKHFTYREIVADFDNYKKKLNISCNIFDALSPKYHLIGITEHNNKINSAEANLPLHLFFIVCDTTTFEKISKNNEFLKTTYVNFLRYEVIKEIDTFNKLANLTFE